MHKSRPTFQFKEIYDISILKIMNELPSKSSTGFNDISMRLMKAVQTEKIPALTCIFHQSLNTGINVNSCIAKVIPIHKKGSISEDANRSREETHNTDMLPKRPHMMGVPRRATMS